MSVSNSDNLKNPCPIIKVGAPVERVDSPRLVRAAEDSECDEK